MIKQNIFIVNLTILYEILDEIKENLPFKINKHERLDQLIKNCTLDIKNSLIILKPLSKIIINKRLKGKKFIFFRKFTIYT